MDERGAEQLKAQMIAKRLVAGGGAGTDGSNMSDPALNAAYRNIFVNDPQGQIVLKDLLRELHYGGMINDMYESVGHNVAIVILTKCSLGADDISDAIIKGI